MRKHSVRWVVAPILIAMMLAGCTQQSPEPATTASTLPWGKFTDQFVEYYLQAHPTFATYSGRHDFDGVMPDWSPAAIEKDIAQLRKQRLAAAAYSDAKLSPQERFERDYLIDRIDRDLFWLDNAQAAYRFPDFYFGTIDTIDPAVYVTRPYAPLDQRASAFIKYAQGIPGVAKQIRANLKVPMPATYVKFGVAGFAGLADFYRNDVVRAFADLSDSGLKEQLKNAVEPAAMAMQELADWLKSTEKQATQDYAIGAKSFADMLWMTERVDTPIDQLDSIGRADLARNTSALKEACAQFMPRAPIAKCIAKVAQNKPQGGAVEGARAQLAQLKDFVIEKQVVTVPSDEEAKVDTAPPYNAQNSAYIDIPGPYDKSMPSVYYIAPPDPSWTKAEQEAYIQPRSSLLFTSVHEVWPGHFLQFLHSNRSSSRFGQLFVGYAFAEGWAHYAEELMWEMGLGNGDPETHIGQLLQALLRDVRFISAIGLHTKGMSVAETEKMFREQAYLDAGNARQQAARGTRDPGYLNYTLGKLMIRKLRQDYTTSRNQEGQSGWHDFHDKFLSYGGPPIPLVRRQMLPDSTAGLF